MMVKKALILVDIQNDFCAGGQFPVPDGEKVIPFANKLQAKFELVLATKDWHPPDHGSFASNHPGYGVGDTVQLGHLPQILWPNHCVQNTEGAEFHPDLHVENIAKVFYKGTDPGIDSYSAFYDNEHLRSTGLSEYLKQQNVTDVYIVGLATDYCVKFSALDAIHDGFKVHVNVDACRAINLHPDDGKNAIEEMKNAGITIEAF